MTLVYRNTLLLFFIIIGLSCSETRTDRTALRSNPALTFSDIFHSRNTLSTSFNTLLLGKRFQITYESYGCFHYTSRYIDVEENNGSFLVTLKDQFSDTAYRRARLNSNFGLALRDFNNYYSQLIETKNKNRPKDESSISLREKVASLKIGTVNRLTIQGGLITTVIFCDDISELSGFNDLVNRIDHNIAK